ncbi:MAG: DegT/DnrJ/EryC1/StrS family aminotransferase [Caldilineaceae bacterium]|nr:DegT/DnrJ/EryC1/StrS family aminotransferase [Caldilineaceae bacterium]
MTLRPIPVIDLRAQYLALQSEIDDAVQRTLASGWYILGQETAAFEAEFAAYLTAGQHAAPTIGCVGVNSGTDALQLALRACGIGPGDEVITVSHTAVATVAAIRLTGATPVLVDIDPQTYTMDPAALPAALTSRTKAIIPVHLYGHPAALDAILAAGRQHGIPVIEDCAQAHGARYHGQRVGTLGDLACFSFYPTKNLGALGDGGAVVGPDGPLLARVRSLREYGWTPQARYISQEEGLNSRLDELQAAILRVKLRHLDQWNQARRALARVYHETLPAQVVRPVAVAGCDHVYHLYVVRVSAREMLRERLQAAGVHTAVHYPAAVHQQPAYQGNNTVVHAMPHTEAAVGEILTLPLYPQMTVAQARAVAAALTSALEVTMTTSVGPSA